MTSSQRRRSGIDDQFEGEAEAALLATGEDLDHGFADRIEPGLLEDAVGDGDRCAARERSLDPEADGALDALVDGEVVVGDAELGDVTDLRGFEIAFLGEVAPLPEDVAVRFLVESGDDLEEGRFPAAGRADDGHEVPGGDLDGRLVDEVEILAVLGDGERDVVEFEHGGSGGWVWEWAGRVGVVVHPDVRGNFPDWRAGCQPNVDNLLLASGGLACDHE